MNDEEIHDDRPLNGLPNPGPIARARFFASRHPIAVAVPLAIIIAFSAATLAAVIMDVSPERRSVFIPGVVAISLSAIGAAIFPAIARMSSTASSRDIAAAVAAANARERPHLLAQIEERLSDPYWLTPMTVFQLVAMFREVRQVHGERAYRRQSRRQAARADQERALAQLAARR